MIKEITDEEEKQINDEMEQIKETVTLNENDEEITKKLT